jgi:hypothetical protein
MRGMNVGEQRQLRDWADRLCAADDSERRAMGRAISMLLDRVDELERELARAGAEPEPEPVFELEPEFDLAPLPEPSDPVSVGEDTQQLSLRDRLRMATDHLRDRGGH